MRAEDDPWTEFRFLMGAWVSEAKPGEPVGEFSFEAGLSGKVLVRKNLADVPAAAGRPAAKHEDLMVVYREPVGGKVRASYFDNEGHVIQYTVTPQPDGKRLVFVTGPEAAGPRFRLTYSEIERDRVKITFETAPPGQEGFRKYLESTARRKSAGG